MGKAHSTPPHSMEQPGIWTQLLFEVPRKSKEHDWRDKSLKVITSKFHIAMADVRGKKVILEPKFENGPLCKWIMPHNNYYKYPIASIIMNGPTFHPHTQPQIFLPVQVADSDLI